MDRSHEEIRDFIRRHQVCWESHPITVMNRGNRVQVGFELELSAVEGEADASLAAGDLRLQQLFEGLRSLALQFVADSSQEVRFEIHPDDHSLRFDGYGLPEVVLKLHMIHREDYFRPIDSALLECLAETEQVLRDVGVQRCRRASG